MTLSPFRLILETLKQSWLVSFGLAALASLPVAILGQAMGWNMMHPGTYLAEFAWLPVMALCQLALLRRMGKILNVTAQHPPLRGAVLASVLGAEFLLGLRLCVVLLLSALPAFVFLSVFGLEPLWARAVFVLLALGAAVPSLNYALRRLFAAPIVLWQGLKASQALNESARLSQGKLGQIIWPLIGLNGIALILEGISGEFMPFIALVLPLSFIIATSATAWAYRILTL